MSEITIQIHGVCNEMADGYVFNMVHLSAENETLCGLRVSGKDWWQDDRLMIFQFLDLAKEPNYEGVCHRCAEKYEEQQDKDQQEEA